MLLALDLSSKSTGWSVFEKQDKIIDYGCIAASNSNLYKRIDIMVEELRKILNTYKITEVIIEEVLPDDFKKNKKTFKALMYLQGFVMHLLNQYNIKEIELIYPSEWRAKCKIKNGRGIKREQEKQLDIDFIKNTYDIIANDDVCDSLCIGYSYFIEEEENAMNWD